MIEEDRYTIPFVGNNYCGPAALAYLTRTDPNHAAGLLRSITNQRAIKGVKHDHMLEAIMQAGRSVRRFYCRAHPDKLPTLQQWIEGNEIDRPGSTDEFLVVITGHYIIVHGNMIFDSKYHLGKPIHETPYLKKRVHDAWLVI